MPEQFISEGELYACITIVLFLPQITVDCLAYPFGDEGIVELT